MANGDGGADRDDTTRDRVRADAARPVPDEPEELASDLPWPPLWSPAVGSAGETLGPNPDIVPLETNSGPSGFTGASGFGCAAPEVASRASPRPRRAPGSAADSWRRSESRGRRA